MKDKPLGQTTMEEFAATKFGGEKKKGIIMPGSPIKSKKLDTLNVQDTNFEQLEKDIEEYNSNLSKLDKEYSSFIPNSLILIRAFHKEVVYDTSGSFIVSPPVTFVPERGVQNAVIRTSQAPWAFSRKAVVVSVPENYEKYKPGDIVQVSGGAVACVKESQKEYSLPLGFTLYEWQDMNPPISKTDKHYGYFLVDPYQHILGKLSSAD